MKTNARWNYLILSLLMFATPTAWIGCSGGGSSSGTVAESTTLPEPTLVASTRETISPAGGALSVGGATVTFPAGAVANDVEVELREYDIPTLALDPSDSSFGGQRPLSDRGYALVASQEVLLGAPLTLALPVDPALLPAGADTTGLKTSALVRGMLIEQGPVTAYDPVAAVATLNLAADTIPDRDNIARVAPMGEGISILAMITLVGTGELLYPILVTIDDIWGLGAYNTHLTGKFNVKYRPSLVTTAQAEAVGSALEKAYDLYMTQMGFSLPNFVNLDSAYTVFIDDFDNYFWVRKVLKATDVDGFCLPGSSLFEGGSYVNTKADANQWASIAVHEYFHALQYGVLLGFAPNLVHNALYPESLWLFEGSTAALSGRVMQGNSTSPARIDYLKNDSFPQQVSLFSPTITPVPGVAQDFFYFLEKGYGNVAFYLPIFEGLEAELGSDVPSSIAATDKVIADLGGTTNDSLTKAWAEFALDVWVESPSDYGTRLRPRLSYTIKSDGTAFQKVTDLPPLSYYVLEYVIPAAAAGESNDFTVELSVPPENSWWATFTVDVERDGARPLGYPDPQFIDDTTGKTEVTISGIRTSQENKVRLIMSNNRTGRADSLTVTANAYIPAVVEPELVMIAKDDTVSLAYGVDVAGGALYAATYGYYDDNGAIRVYSTGSGMAQAGSLEVTGARDIRNAGAYTCVATGYTSQATYLDNGGLKVFNPASPGGITEVASVGFGGGYAWSVDVLGQTAYVAVESIGLYSVDLSNPEWCATQPCSLVAYTEQRYADVNSGYHVKIVGDHLYLADGTAGLKIFSLASGLPVLVGTWDPAESGSVHGVDVNGDMAFVADTSKGFFIVDISDKTSPATISNMVGGYNRVAYGGGYVFTAGNGGVGIADISDPANPFWRSGFFSTPYQAEDIQYVGPDIYVGDRSGVYLLRYE